MDSQLREAERCYQTEDSEENKQRYHNELKRAGICCLPEFDVHFANGIQGTQIFFRVQGVGNKCPLCHLKPQAYFITHDDNGDKSAPREATLINADSPIVVGNSIDDLGAGETIYSVGWDTAADGVTDSDSIRVWGRIEYEMIFEK